MPRGDSAIAGRFRAFNRFYTPLIGTLARGYLDTPYGLAEARVLFELGARPGSTATELRARAGFGQAHLSRILARLERAGLVRRATLAHDRRAASLRLTAKGKRAFATLDARADDQAHALLGRLDAAQRARLAEAMETIEGLLSPTAREPSLVLREGRVGDLGWTFHRQAVVYKEEFGYLDAFERYLSEGYPPYLQAFDPTRDRLWIAQLDGRSVGSVAIQHAHDRPGWAKLRWFLVEKEARGRGAGGALLQAALAFAREAGHAGILLWTVDDLRAARRLYERAGFRLAFQDEKPCAWAPWAHEQRWELPLREDLAP